MRNIIFRTDSSPQNNNMHLKRSLILAESFLALGWECSLLVKEKTLKTCEFLMRCNVNIIVFENFSNNTSHNNTFFDLLIVDHPDDEGFHFEQKWRTRTKKIVVIDNFLSNKKSPDFDDCDFLIDPDPKRTIQDYQGLIPKKSKLLVGARFSFIDWNNSATELNKYAFLNFMRELQDSNPESENQRQLILTLAKHEDIEVIFNWQQDPNIRKYARNTAAPTWEEHQNWFKKCLTDKKYFLLIIKYDGIPVGVLRLDKIASPISQFKLSEITQENKQISAYEISILIAPEMQNRGIALKALQHARALFPNIEIWAEIFPQNTKSIVLFTKAGYRPIQDCIFANLP